MAKVKLVYGSTTESYWNSTSKITTPSLILNDGTTNYYTPLLSGSAGDKVNNGDYYYTLGHLIVGGKRGALSQYLIAENFNATVSFYYSLSSAIPTKYGSGSSGTVVYIKYCYIHAKVKITSEKAKPYKIYYNPTGSYTTTTISGLDNDTYETVATLESGELATETTSWTPPSDFIKGTFKITIKANTGFTLDTTTHTCATKTVKTSAQSYTAGFVGTKS